MAWDEWEQLKAEAGERSTQMQLNRLPEEQPGGGGEKGGDLKVSQNGPRHGEDA